MNCPLPSSSTPSKPTSPRPATGRSPSSWLWLALVAVIVAGWFQPLIGLAVPVCFMGAVLTAVFMGRKWCGKVCPRGNFSDTVLARVVRGRSMPLWARSWVIRMMVMLVMFTIMAVKLPPVWGDWPQVGRVFWLMLTVTTVVGTLVGLFTHQRVWCAVCPAGTLASWVGKERTPKLTVAQERCNQCTLCWRTCPMDLRPSEMAASPKHSQADCLKCGRCTAACRRNALALHRENRTLAEEPETEAA